MRRATSTLSRQRNLTVTTSSLRSFTHDPALPRVSPHVCQELLMETLPQDLDTERKRANNRAYYRRNKSVLITKVELTLTILVQRAADHHKDTEEAYFQ